MTDGGDKVVGGEFDVFISYAHADKEEDSDRSPAQTLAAMLEAEGYRVYWDRQMIAGEDWLRELPTNIGLSRKVVALVSPRWLASKDCYAEMVRAYETPGKLVPVLIADCSLPPAIAHLNAVKATTNLKLTKSLILAAIEIQPKKHTTTATTTADPNRVQVDKLPSGADHLFGRDTELTTLNNAWTATGPGKKNVVVFHAIGGAGKSALVRAFVNDLAAKGYPGAAKVYGWSAYSQGSGENRDTANAEGFIADALKFFGHDLAEMPITDGIERGRTLARLARQQRTLFILDGLEPLQDAPLVNGGRLKDRGLAAFITMLADDNPGLLVITSRQELPELDNRPLVVNHSLNQLDVRAGAELLKHLGVHGRERELMDAVNDVGGHALSVSLLGTYLANVCAGDVTRRDTLKLGDIIEDMAEQDETARKARRAQRVMEAYDRRFHELAAGSKGHGVAELMIMRLVGLFNRPAEPEAIAAVLAEPPIPGLTEAWYALTSQKRQSQWGFALARLRKLKLLLGADAEAEGPLDAHPVVRQHFGAELQRTAPEAFREANDRLYRYYVALPEKEFPDTLAEMEPLFHAIAHGCAAGRHQEVWSKVFQGRVSRGGGTYLVYQLGAFSAFLGALANFFASPWGTPHPHLTDPTAQAAALGYAAFALRALGRLRDAIEPMAAGAERRVAQKDWRNAAIDYSNLNELRLTLGDVAEAVTAGRQSIAHADTSGEGDWENFIRSRATLADALKEAGVLPEAERLFRGAEAMQSKHQPGLDNLYSMRGYRYCDLLLDRGAAAEVRKRYEWLVSVRQSDDALLDRGLEELLAGRAAHALGDGTAARRHLDAAVEGLRRAGQEHHIPRSLLARAAFRRDTGDLAGAQQDLTETHEIADRGGMRLFLTDYHLGMARLLMVQVPKPMLQKRFLRPPILVPPVMTPEHRALIEKADTHVRAAADLIADTGYHRRDGDLAALRAEVDQARHM